MLDIGFYIFYLLLFVAVAAAVVFPIIQAVKTPGALGKSLIGVGALVVVFVIAYLLSGSDVDKDWAAMGITPGASKLIGAGLIMFYLALIASVLALFYSEISKALK